jgi:hypothetical protein
MWTTPKANTTTHQHQTQRHPQPATFSTIQHIGCNNCICHVISVACKLSRFLLDVDLSMFRLFHLLHLNSRSPNHALNYPCPVAVSPLDRQATPPERITIIDTGRRMGHTFGRRLQITVPWRVRKNLVFSAYTMPIA